MYQENSKAHAELLTSDLCRYQCYDARLTFEDFPVSK